MWFKYHPDLTFDQSQFVPAFLWFKCPIFHCNCFSKALNKISIHIHRFRYKNLFDNWIMSILLKVASCSQVRRFLNLFKSSKRTCRPLGNCRRKKPTFSFDCTFTAIMYIHILKRRWLTLCWPRGTACENSVCDRISSQRPLDDDTLDLSTDQSGALHHNNSMCLAAAWEHATSPAWMETLEPTNLRPVY